jgi:hypothetical protein
LRGSDAGEQLPDEQVHAGEPDFAEADFEVFAEPHARLIEQRTLLGLRGLREWRGERLLDEQIPRFHLRAEHLHLLDDALLAGA